MTLKTISQEIDIDAARERVWDVLLQDETYRQWTAVFAPGSHADTDWQEGSKVAFADGSGQGLVGHITTSRRPEEVAIEYDGALVGGREDRESEGAASFKGAQERYRLTERDGGTHLAISADMDEKYFESMNEQWVSALAKVKELAER